jgi:hypothetical protein
MANIRGWFLRGKGLGATHMIVVCDIFDYEDYPVYVQPGQNVRDMEREYRHKSMQNVMEVYNLALDMDRQLAEHRSFNY